MKYIIKIRISFCTLHSFNKSQFVLYFLINIKVQEFLIKVIKYKFVILFKVTNNIMINK